MSLTLSISRSSSLYLFLSLHPFFLLFYFTLPLSLSLYLCLPPSLSVRPSSLTISFRTKKQKCLHLNIYIYVCIGSFCSVLFSFQCDACAHVRSQEHEVLKDFLIRAFAHVQNGVCGLTKSLPSLASVGHRQIKTGHVSCTVKLLRCVGAQCILALIFLSSDDFPPD